MKTKLPIWTLIWLPLASAVLSLVLSPSFIGSAGAQSTAFSITSPATITGDGAKHALATSGTCQWVVIKAVKGNSADIMIGDTNTSSSRGLALVSTATDGGSLRIDSLVRNGIVLSSIYYYAATGDKLTYVWGN